MSLSQNRCLHAVDLLCPLMSLFLVSWLTGCTEEESVSVPVDPEVTWGERQGAETCPPSMSAYPVAGPHNGGWDANALTYGCNPHPANAPDNSDFIANDHYGNDIFAAEGTPLVACVDGTVSNVASTAIGGLNVTIKDDCGWFYYYAHLSAIEPGLQIGQAIEAGDPIGAVGNTGSAINTSPHLHFSVFPGVYTDGIDPFPLLESVDHTACPDEPPVGPAEPIVSFSSDATGSDFRPEGASQGVADVYEDDTVTVRFYVHADADGGETVGKVWLGYSVEAPYLEVLEYAIDTDWPELDQSSWVATGAVGSDGNPAGNQVPTSAKLALKALAPGETLRVTLWVRGEEYSIGATDHPDVRGWVWSIPGYYSEMTGYNDAVELNQAGTLLRASHSYDVFGKTHWEWNGTAPETEGWSAMGSEPDLLVNTVDHCLAIEQDGSNPRIRMQDLALDTAIWKGFQLRVRHYAGTEVARLYWRTAGQGSWSEERSATFETLGEGAFHTATLNLSDVEAWSGTVERLRLDPTPNGQGFFDIDWLRAVTNPGPTSGDADQDGYLSTEECDDGNAAVSPDAVEVCNSVDDNCDGATDEGFDEKGPEICDNVDNDCDGQVDEGVTNACGGCGVVPSEVCDGIDNDCDGILPADESDLDEDGQLPCQGDCDDGDPAVYAGAPELCDGADNDCDKDVDEMLDVGEACSVGQGVCAANGTVLCNAALEAVCDAIAILPTGETCDGLDNDCDGDTDEDFGLGGSCEVTAVGCARIGTWVCAADGSGVICSAPPTEPVPEVCDGQDNDCDGETDEDFELLESCTVGAGSCEAEGFLACGDDGQLFCKAPKVDGDPELCDAVDNDCDGKIDEGFPVDEACVTLLDGCERAGTWECDPTGIETICNTEGSPCLPVDEPGSTGDSGTSDSDGDTSGVDPEPDGGASTGGTAATTGGAGAAGGVTRLSVAGEEPSGCALSTSPNPPTTFWPVWFGLGLLTLARQFQRRRARPERPMC